MVKFLANRLFARLIFLCGIVFIAWGNFRVCESMYLAWENFDKTMSTKFEMRQIARFIEIDFIDSKKIPGGPEAIRAKMETHLRASGRPVTANTGKDRWGTRYQIGPLKGSAFSLYSAGPDRRWKSRARDNLTYQKMLPSDSRGSAAGDGPATAVDNQRNRQWTDHKGRRVVGTLKTMTHDSVEILATNGTVVKVRIDRLSPADRKYVMGLQ